MLLHLTATATFLVLALAAPNPPASSPPAPSPPTGTPGPPTKHIMAPAIFSSKTNDCSLKNGGIIKGNDINEKCQPFQPMSNNIHVFFGAWDSVATAITLYTDQNCKNVGKVGALKKPANNVTCVHPSDFGGEVWGSVMQTEGNTWWNP